MPPQTGQQNSTSNTKSLWKSALVVLVALIVGAGAGAYGFYLWQKPIIVTPVVENSASEDSYFPYQILTSPTYTNKALGFSLTVPSSWTRYAIREDTVWPNIIVTVSLPVQNASSTRFLGYPEESSKIIDIDHFQITRTELWKSDKGSCDGADGPCVEQDVIASSTKYVFSTLYPRPHAGWGFAQDWGISEPYVVAVWKDFDLDKSLKFFEPSDN